MSAPDRTSSWARSTIRFKFPEKLIDLTDARRISRRQVRRLVSGRAQRYGNAAATLDRAPAGRDRRLPELPHQRTMQAAGFDEFPKDTAGFLKLCQALKKNGTPAGFALGHATGDANGWAHWCSVGLRRQDRSTTRTRSSINSPETVAALEYAKQLYATFIAGRAVVARLRATTRRSSPARLSLTLNGISIYTVAKNSPDPALQAIAEDMNHANMPIGPVGRADRAAEHAQHLRLQVHEVSERGRSEYLRFMWEKEQVDAWEAAVERLRVAAAAGLERQSGLDGRSEGHAVPRRPEVLRSTTAMPATLGYASAAVMGDFVVVDMFAEACTGRTIAEGRGARRGRAGAKRYYKV